MSQVKKETQCNGPKGDRDARMQSSSRINEACKVKSGHRGQEGRCKESYQSVAGDLYNSKYLTEIFVYKVS